MNPFGQKVEDSRFMALRSDIYHMSSSLQYLIRKVATGKGTRPKSREILEFAMYQRHGMPKGKRDFRDKTPEEIAEKMNRFKAVMDASKRPR